MRQECRGSNDYSNRHYSMNYYNHPSPVQQHQLAQGQTRGTKQSHRHDAGGHASTQSIPSSNNQDDSICAGRDHRTCSSNFMLQPPSPAEQATISSSSTSLHYSIHNGATTAGAAGPYTDYTRMTNNGSCSYYNNTSMWEPLLPRQQTTTTSTPNALWSLTARRNEFALLHVNFCSY